MSRGVLCVLGDHVRGQLSSLAAAVGRDEARGLCCW